MTKTAGVIGWPVSHSLSPRLHGYWLDKYRIDGEYKAWPVKPEELGSFITSMVEKGFAGGNVTVPHKEAAMRLVNEMDAEAKAIGAVNTLVISKGIIQGSNTDAYGFTENIRPFIKGTNKAVVLGAGGAARAVVHALKKLGFARIVVTNRTPEKAEALAKLFSVETAPWEYRMAALEGADILVNTTSLGMTGKENLEIDLSLLPKTALVTDIVYAPLITPLLVAARARGNPTVDGLGMLLHQAVPGFEAWFGVKPEVTDELRRYLLT